ELLGELERGGIRAALRGEDGVWRAQAWVKLAILAGFRSTRTVPIEGWPGGAFDRSAFPPRRLGLEDGVRLVPGGSSVRRGAYLGPGVVIMPPAYVNVGAWVGAGTMVDSHALVGSCAQIGERVHLSAAAQVGGVLEPAGARPVVVEDDCFIGALCGLFEGVVLRRRAVLAPGLILTASTTVFDLVGERELSGEIPEGAVVVPGSRPAKGGFARERGISLYVPCIVKYRDQGTDAATALEGALR
ncbi:MAG TPA: 2,3,4,5-tetrahydropyridine-2,6-dicarboxylate N-succinyltransferase, partial [Rectinemataceae bacterium]|nr:2,3,4,5-tetrahydropyridine-2,6-dicarboxylate N-succinyltransferase [Rectinemataceae bacterium]